MNADARDTLLAGVGVACIALAVGAVVGIAPSSATDAVSAVDATLAMGLLGVGLLGYAFVRRRRNDAGSSDSRLAERPSENESEGSGREFDRELQVASHDANAAVVQTARESVRERVRETAVRAYARKNSVSLDDARDAVAAGAWTDDVVAAAFTGDERAPQLPLRERLRGWIHPDRAYNRRAKRAVDAAHKLATEGSR
jgi:hypothetical protein